jgi:hypothetical protein
MGQFGGSSQDDDFGYFGSAKPTSAAGSQFGEPAAGPSPYGAPPSAAPGANSTFGGNPAFGTATGSPTGLGGTGYRSNTPPIPQRRKPWLRGITAVALAIGALWLGNFVYMMHGTSKPITMPTALAGRSATVDPRLLQAQSDVVNEIRSDNKGMTIDVGIYGDTTRDLAVAIVGRGRIDVDKEWRDAGSPVRIKIGKNECAQMPDRATAICVRTSRTLAAEVVLIGPTSEAAAALDELWAAQP